MTSKPSAPGGSTSTSSGLTWANSTSSRTRRAGPTSSPPRNAKIQKGPQAPPPTPDPGPQPLNPHLELLATSQRDGKRSDQLGDLLQVFQTHQFHRGVHVTVRQADQRAGNSAARPEDRVGIRAARR